VWSALQPVEWLALALGIILAVIMVRSWARARLRSRTARRRGARAVAGEAEAERLLRAEGYRIIESQATRTWLIETDDGELPIELRADLIVERDGRQLVAEVKTGDAAPSLTNAATRRQLLEYAVAYPVDGALLVDVEAAHILEVAFPTGTARHRHRPGTVITS
jgi:hypothetical protein